MRKSSSRSRCGQSNLLRRQKLRWIHAPSAAVHQLLFPELVKSDVELTNSREVHGPVVAEHVMALIFALAKKIPQAALLQQKRIWGQEAMWNEGARPREIAGATLGLIGVGSIGRPGGADGIGPGHARDRGARACGEREVPRAWRQYSLLAQIDEMLQAIRLRRAGCAADRRDTEADQCATAWQ